MKKFCPQFWKYHQKINRMKPKKMPFYRELTDYLKAKKSNDLYIIMDKPYTLIINNIQK